MNSGNAIRAVPDAFKMFSKGDHFEFSHMESILKEINPEYSLKDWCWSSNILAIWCEQPTHLEKTLMLRKIEGRRRRGWQRTRWLDGITDSMDMNLSSSGGWWRTGKPGMPHAVHIGHCGWPHWGHSVRHDCAATTTQHQLAWAFCHPFQLFQQLSSLHFLTYLSEW